MRYTSQRRRDNRPTAHNPVPAQPTDYSRRAARPGPLALPTDDPAATCCPDCGTWVKTLANGNPKAHAAGGYGPSVRNNRPACPTSGQLA